MKNNYTASDLSGMLKGARRDGDGWMCCCPAHNDKNPSLRISDGANGKTTVHCFAGCSRESVLDAMGLTIGDLNGWKPSRGQSASKTAKSFTPKTIEATYDYCDASGKLVYQAVRYVPKTFRLRRPDGNGGWIANMDGVERIPYRLPELIAAVSRGDTVYICEGEKDVNNMFGEGFVATCNPSGAGKWLPSMSEYLRGADVVILPDQDEPGRKHGESVARALFGIAKKLRIFDVHGKAGQRVKDISDWFANGNTAQGLRDSVDSVNVWTPLPASLTGGIGFDLTKTPFAEAKNGIPLSMTDLGNAERMFAQYGDDLLWDSANRAWYVWNGSRWVIGADETVYSLACKTVRNIQIEAAIAPLKAELDGKTVNMSQMLSRHATVSESHTRLNAMLNVLKCRPELQIKSGDFDNNPMLLGCSNGTLDLTTGKLIAPDRAHRMTKTTGIAYNALARDERFEQFLRDSTGSDGGFIDFLQVMSGYTLTGSTAEEKMMMVYGPTASGKTTFLETLKAVMGDYATTINPALLVKKRFDADDSAASPTLARLPGVRLAGGSELEAGQELAQALAKSLTGSETITARQLYGRGFTFTPQFKLWLAVNHLPFIDAEDCAVWRRILVVQFDHTVPPERRDATLKPWLCNPEGGAPAVLAWAVRGCMRWQKFGIEVPQKVVHDTKAYQDDNNDFGCFFEDCLELGQSDDFMSWKSLENTYNQWCDDNGIKERFRKSKRYLTMRLKKFGVLPARTRTIRGFSGIRFNRNESVQAPKHSC